MTEKLAAFAVRVERFVSGYNKKLYKKRLAYMIWEYENETKPRLERLEKMLKEKGIINIYTFEDLSR